MRFALVTADPAHKAKFRINPFEGDATSFMNWIDVWDGWHLSYEALRTEDLSYLKQFEVVMMSGHPGHLADIIRIARYLKDTETVSMFYPEGSAQLYDNSINGFHKETYDAWRACDVLSIVEEDKQSYYEAFVDKNTAVRFVHVPLRPEMESGRFLRPRAHKSIRHCVVYGDNNPNHPMIALACANKMGMSVTAVEIDRGGRAVSIAEVFPKLDVRYATKLGCYYFLNLLAQTAIHFYPSEWIGTARQQISCAVTGTLCIGSHDCHTQQRLFPPLLSRNIYDIEGMVAAAVDISKMDEEKYDTFSKWAFQKASFYGLNLTKQRFVAAVEAGRRCKVHKHSVPA